LVTGKSIKEGIREITKKAKSVEVEKPCTGGGRGPDDREKKKRGVEIGNEEEKPAGENISLPEKSARSTFGSIRKGRLVEGGGPTGCTRRATEKGEYHGLLKDHLF